MVKLLLLVAVLGLFFKGNLANAVHETPGVTPAETIITPGEEIEDQLHIENLANRLGLPDVYSLKIEQSRKIANGLTRHKIRIYYKCFPIRVFTLQASTDENGMFTSAVSGYIPRIDDLDVSVSNTKRDLLIATTDFVNRENQLFGFEEISARDIENFEYEKQIQVDTETGEACVVYFCRGLIDLPGTIRNPKVIFAAGDTLRFLNGSIFTRKASSAKSCPVVQGGNQKVPGLKYGPGGSQVCLNARVTGNQCEFANDKVIVKTVNNGFDRKTAEVVEFKCSKGPDDESNGAYSPSADTFYYSQRFYDMFEDWADMDISGKDPVVLFTHYGQDLENSFFDGYSVTFGDGHLKTYPFAVPELIAHEMCHAFTDSLGNLNFYGESVAVDEAFSDICGQCFDFYVNSNSARDWRYGFDLVKAEGEALRYFDDPSGNKPYIIDNYDNRDQAVFPTQLRGILHKFFYLIVEKGDIPVNAACEAMIHANVIYFQDETSFIDGACGILRAASDVGLKVKKFKRAFEAVGIDLDFCSLEGTVDFISGPVSRSRYQAKVDEARQSIYLVEGGSSVSVDVFGSDVTVEIVDNNKEVIATGSNSVHADIPGNIEAGVRVTGHGKNRQSVDVDITVE